MAPIEAPRITWGLQLPGLLVHVRPAGSVVFGWFFERTRGSLTIASLLHLGAHLDHSHLALPTEPWPSSAHTVAFVALAVRLVVADRSLGRAPAARGRAAGG